MITIFNKILNRIPIPNHILSYLIIGGFSALTYMIVYNLSVICGIHMLKIDESNNILSIISVLLAFLFAWAVSFIFNSRITFKTDTKRSKIVIVKDFIRNVIVFIAMQLLTYVCINLLGLNHPITSFIAAGSSPVLSYPLMKYWVFKNPKA